MSKQIILAKTAGFCFGVDRAVNLVYELVNKGEKVCTLGPIIHNAQLVDDLKSKGVKIIDDVSQSPEGYTVVVRTHGVEKEVVDELENRKIVYVNATCPFVTKIHMSSFPPPLLRVVFQGYLRCCLPGLSPNFTPNKT